MSPFAFADASASGRSWMSYNFSLRGVVIHSSPVTGCQVWPVGKSSIVTLLKPYSFANRAITSLSRKCVWYSDGGRTN